jgi:ankyrin repeat protein
LKAGANVNFRGAYDLTPLWWAAWDQNLRGFTRLLERGADPNVVPSKNSPLMNNISEAFWPIGFLRAALAHGGNPNLADKNGRDPLTAAMQQGTRAHVDLLLAAGANVNQRPGEQSAGPIFSAVMAGRFDYVLMLLERGADPTAKDRTGKDVARLIELFPYDPNSEHYVWRERVIRFLKSKGIEAHPPPNEGKRTKALPADLR